MTGEGPGADTVLGPDRLEVGFGEREAERDVHRQRPRAVSVGRDLSGPALLARLVFHIAGSVADGGTGPRSGSSIACLPVGSFTFCSRRSRPFARALPSIGAPAACAGVFAPSSAPFAFSS